MAERLFTVSSDGPAYVSPIIGNGEVVTTVGPTGYHNGLCPDREQANRAIFWAGRRLNTPTHALVRFGWLNRALTLDGAQTQDQVWEQAVDYPRGMVVSTLDHGPLREQTRSLVCLTANVLVFHTRLENGGDRPARLTFTLEYEFPTAIEPHLRFPYMTHFDFRPGYLSSEGDSADIRARVRPAPSGASLSVLYHIGAQLGEVRLGWWPDAQVTETESGGRFTHAINLKPGEATDLWFWIMLSDRRKYTHFPDFARVNALVEEHERAWGAFWGASRLELGDPELEALRQTCLYAIRCSASPWSVPPAYLSTHWEGRTFHDELYPFLALMSSNHPELAARIPAYRLSALPVALQYGGDRGARFPWEALEDGREGGPYGHWMDERFHVGQFSETAWRYYLYTRDPDELARYYPLLRECAELFVQDVIVRDKHGRLKTRSLTDFDEGVFPLENGVFTICAAIRSLENAAQAAGLLGFDTARREKWRALAAELREALSVDETGRYYRVSDDRSHWHIAQMGMVYPFSFETNSARARETLSQLHAMLRTSLGFCHSHVSRERESHWMWIAGLLATGFFYQGRGDEGYEVLRRAPASAGPFLSPNEHRVPADKDDRAGGARLPWFTTGAGAVVYAMHAMLVQVDGTGTVLFRGLPSALQNIRFERIAASHGVRVSGQVRDGVLVSLAAHSDRAMTWQFRIPAALATTAAFTDAVRQTGRDEAGLALLESTLTQGETGLI